MSSFAFNFADDDIETSAADGADIEADPLHHGTTENMSSTNVPVVEHNVHEWLSTLPSQISYSSITITSPTGTTISLPRRELFDIRTQLMAEDASDTLLDLSTSDLRTNVYEGGFKTWECSVDLASLLLDRGPRKDIDELAQVAHVVELGCGSALPSLVLFRHALRNGFGVGFTLADYNADVLRLVTLPNLLLTWAVGGEQTGEESGELNVTPELVQGFLDALQRAGMSVALISGPWGKELAARLPSSASGLSTLVLAAETIYSPATLQAFMDLLAGVLQGGQSNKALVAAKRFYFGVGGSVDALKAACRDAGLIASEVENHGLPDMEQGVGRAILEVQTI